MDVRESPVYSLREAAGYVRVPASTVSSWMAPRGMITPACTAPTTLSFSNLVELFVLSVLRNEHEFSTQSLRKAVAYVRSELAVARPLAHAKFRTDGVHLFVDHLGSLVNVSKNGQTALRDLMGQYLERIEYEQEAATRFYPFVRAFGLAPQPRSVVIDPDFGFGKPVIAGTGIRTSAVVDRYMAGESMTALAEDYRLDPSLVEDAIRAQMREAA
ncbi:MAG: DUF433 domain-containing protein [Polyangiaceae bacterium]